MNTSSIVYADVGYFDRNESEAIVGTELVKKDFWMGTSSAREDE